MPTRQNRVRNKPLPLWLDNFQQALRPSNRERTKVDFRITKYTIENEGGPLTPYANINSKQTKGKKNLKLYTIPREKKKKRTSSKLGFEGDFLGRTSKHRQGGKKTN